MRIAVIPGDGIGKDVTAEAVKVLRAVAEKSGRKIELRQLPWSADHFLATGETLPADGYRMLREEFAAIFVGALGDPRVPENRHARDIPSAPDSSSISTSTTGRCDCSTIASRR
jgi:3-isopropylmalate dehydrogenase